MKEENNQVKILIFWITGTLIFWLPLIIWNLEIWNNLTQVNTQWYLQILFLIPSVSMVIHGLSRKNDTWKLWLWIYNTAKKLHLVQKIESSIIFQKIEKKLQSIKNNLS